jgi:DNA polymerase-3 subunit alpha
MDERVVEELSEIIAEHPGRTKLFFQLRDSAGKNHVLLRSQTRMIDVKNQLIEYIEQNPALDYQIN